MAAYNTPLLVLADVLQCLGIGFYCAALAALLPRGSSTVRFWNDFCGAGLVLLLLQSYGAARSSAGMLRWYMLAAAAAGAAAGEWLLFLPCARLREGLRRLCLWPMRQTVRLLSRPLYALGRGIKGLRAREIRKKQEKLRKKQLHKPHRLLYNLNV